MANADEILNKLLVQIAKEQNFVNCELKVEPISSGGANYTSELYNVTMKEGDRVINMFAKVAAMGEKVRTQTPKFYGTERFVYTKLTHIYKKLEDEQQVPQEHRLIFPKFYGLNPTLYEEIVVLEDLVVEGYEAFDRFKSITWEYGKSAMSELAKMHALSYAYSEYYPEEFSEVATKLKFEWNTDDGMMADYMAIVEARAVNAANENTRDKLKAFFDNQGMKEMQIMFQWANRPVLTHGDYKPGNLMHKNREDGTVDIKIVDLQTLQGASPVIDLLYFIFTGSDEQFRAQYYDKLIDHYYTQLAAAMKRLHLDPEKIYSRADFDSELKEKLPFGLTIAVFSLPVVTVAAEDAPKVNEDMDITSFSIDKTSDLYTERLNGVVNDYVKWGVLK